MENAGRFNFRGVSLCRIQLMKDATVPEVITVFALQLTVNNEQFSAYGLAVHAPIWQTAI